MKLTAKSKDCRAINKNKFLGGAKDSGALYIVSDDKDLLVLKSLKSLKRKKMNGF